MAIMGWDFQTVWQMNGCIEHCAYKKHGVTPADLLLYHNHFSQIPKPGRRQWLLDYFNAHTSKNVDTNEAHTTYLICGISTCQPLWLATIGVSHSFFYGVRKGFLHGQVKTINDAQRAPLQVIIATLTCILISVHSALASPEFIDYQLTANK
jgi:hypothetical protein